MRACARCWRQSTADPKSVTRDYLLDFDRSGPPLLSVYGGKLTTYRRLAEDVVDMITPVLGANSTAWTATVPLPGGDMEGADFDAFVARMRRRYPWLEAPLLERYARAYGTRMAQILDGCAAMTDLGAAVLPGVHAREINYLRTAEFARTATDILYRRSKLGLHLPAGSTALLDAWLAANPVAA